MVHAGATLQFWAYAIFPNPFRPRRINFVSAVETLRGKTKARGRDFLKSLSLKCVVPALYKQLDFFVV